jgi:hypothetical protein
MANWYIKSHEKQSSMQKKPIGVLVWYVSQIKSTHEPRDMLATITSTN